MPAFGKFPSFNAFIKSYRVERKREFLEEIALLPLPQQIAELKKHRDVVEVKGTLKKREPDDLDGDKHYRLHCVIREVIEPDEHVQADVARCIKDQCAVFIAIRYGDDMGVRDEIPGLDPGADLHLRGEWIPAERAYSHGGEKLSVLHFTHHPIGFICVAEVCHS